MKIRAASAHVFRFVFLISAGFLMLIILKIQALRGFSKQFRRVVN